VLATFLAVFALVAALLGLGMVAMAIGLVSRGRCLRGSCGGPEVHGPGGERISCAGCPNARRERR
jgi:hypothetical protein